MDKFKELKQITDKYIEDIEALGYVVYQEEDKDNIVLDIEEKK